MVKHEIGVVAPVVRWLGLASEMCDGYEVEFRHGITSAVQGKK